MNWNPCPACGYCFDFEPTGCMTGVTEMLKANGDRCPRCSSRIDYGSVDDVVHPLAHLKSLGELRHLPITQLPLSVRCMNMLIKRGLKTFGDVIDVGREPILSDLTPPCADELVELFTETKVDW